MLYFAHGAPDAELHRDDIRKGLFEALDRLGERRKVIAVPPDITRFHSHAGLLTEAAWEYYGDRLTDVMPAIGTHFPMTDEEIAAMYGQVPKELFRVHDWKNNLDTLGVLPGEFLAEISEGLVDYSWPAQVDTLVSRGSHDLILSVGQVVPHEVIGMANYTKNIFVGTGGREGINKSHYLGAVWGAERIMGRQHNPVRRLMDEAADRFARHLPIVYVLTVVSRKSDGTLAVRGLFVGDDEETFTRACELAAKVNITILDRPVDKVVAYLQPDEFKSTWIGNKSVYRTRMMIADGGELLVLAPGVREFGEDPTMDLLIRKYGYVGTERVLELTRQNEDLQESLGAAAHLIHGSSDGRFTITYCPGHLSRDEIEGVNFRYADVGEMMKRYDPAKLKDGFNRMPDGEEIFFVSNPAVGLWAYREKFREE